MYCPHCGTQLADDARFCASCGQPTGVQAVPQPAQPVQTSAQPAAQPVQAVQPTGAQPAQSAPQPTYATGQQAVSSGQPAYGVPAGQTYGAPGQQPYAGAGQPSYAGVGAANVMSPGARKKRTILIYGAIAAALLLVGAGIFGITRLLGGSGGLDLDDFYDDRPAEAARMLDDAFYLQDGESDVYFSSPMLATEYQNGNVAENSSHHVGEWMLRAYDSDYYTIDAADMQRGVPVQAIDYYGIYDQATVTPKELAAMLKDAGIDYKHVVVYRYSDDPNMMGGQFVGEDSSGSISVDLSDHVVELWIYSYRADPSDVYYRSYMDNGYEDFFNAADYAEIYFK